jgi:integrase
MSLTDIQVRKAAPGDRDYKLADGGGLFLLVTKSGAKSWRMKYRYARQEKLLTFGLYPEVSLTEARDRRDEARKLLRDNIDPGLEKAKAKLTVLEQAGQTFEKLAREWHDAEKGRWSKIHAGDVLHSLERDIFPEIGSMPIRQIDAPMVLAALRKIEDRGSIETAKRCRQRISAVFVRAISEGKAKDDPAAVVMKALKPKPKAGKQPAIVDLEKVRKVLVAAETAGAYPVTKLASRTLALTAVRPSIVRCAEWTEFEEIDWDVPAAPGSHPNALWRVPAAKMKLILDRKDEDAFEHLVTLSWQAVACLQAVRRLTGRTPLVFPNQRFSHRPLSENAIGYLYNRVGYHGRHVPHGWRAAFSTIMNEHCEREARKAGQPLLAQLDAKVIDMTLAHVPKEKVEAAYNRATFMERRRELAQEWADMLCEGLSSAEDLLFGPRRGVGGSADLPLAA